MKISYTCTAPVKLLTLAVLTLAVWWQPTSVFAAPITFEYTVSSTDTKSSPIVVMIGGQPVEYAESIKITASGDTSKRIPLVIVTPIPGAYVIPHTEATFEYTTTSGTTSSVGIEITPGTLSTGSATFDGAVGLVVVVNGAYQRALFQATDTGSFLNWDMTTSASGSGKNNGTILDWDTGTPFILADTNPIFDPSLRVANATNANWTFSATVSSTLGVAPVPVPFGIGLLGSALVCLGGLRSLHRRKQQN